MNTDALLDALADRLGLADRDALGALGTPEQVLDHYADHARQTPDAGPRLTAADVQRVQAEVDAKYAPDTARASARERLGL